MTTATFIPCDTATLLRQIGTMNILAVSGGRVLRRPTGITLPVGHGYCVTVDLDASDTYTVRRLFTRSGKATVKGEVAGVHADAIGESAYRASCYGSGPFGA